MAKMAKDTQTDYTRGGKAISDVAIPYYQSNLNRIEDYLQDPTVSIDRYLDKYFSNNADQSDFLRAYERNMANTTGNNYSATTGGYTSSGQRAYDDQQRYMNDLASRLQQYGISTSADLANRDYQNLLQGNTAYNNAYRLGEAYSDIERYNNMVNQNNSFLNQAAGVLPVAGAAVGSLFGPVGSAVGKAIGSTAGGLMSTDTSNLSHALGAGGAQSSGAGTQGDMYVNNPKTGGFMYNPNNPSGIFGMLSTGALSNNRTVANNQTPQSQRTLFDPALLRQYGIDPNSI